MSDWLLVLIGLPVGAAVCWLWLSRRSAKRDDEFGRLQGDLRTAQDLHQQDQTRTEVLQSEFNSEQQAHQRVREQHAALNGKLEAFQEQEQSLEKQLREATRKHLEEMQVKMDERSKASLKTSFEPIEKQFKAFGEQLERQGKETKSERDLLQNSVKSTHEMNKQLSADAQGLTEALKGQAKVRGDWGEIQLARVLEASGLQEGRDYQTQASFRSEDGDIQRPDVIVQLPHNRQVIIDAKVALVNFVDYANASSDEEREQHLQKHVRAIRQHMQNLHSANYQNLPEIHSLDFVLMFVPMENAYSVALETSQQLFQEAMEKRIGLVSPNTLMPTLRIIEHIWQSDRQQKNTEEIVKLAKGLWNKLNNVLASMKKADRQLESARKSFDQAMGQISTGRGNLTSRVEKLSNYGVTGTDSLPGSTADDDADVNPQLLRDADEKDDSTEEGSGV